MADASSVYQAERRAVSAQASLESAEVRDRDLVVRSPIAGTVLTPRTKDLGGRYVVAGTLLAEVGDCKTMTAEVPVSERLLEYLRTGAPVTALVRTASMETRRGSVARISSAALGQPPTLTGEEPRVPSAMPERFVALAVFPNGDGHLLPGAAARVKLHLRRESYASRMWSVFWRWLRTLVW